MKATEVRCSGYIQSTENPTACRQEELAPRNERNGNCGLPGRFSYFNSRRSEKSV